MEKAIHVLHVLGGVGLGGAESRIMDLYRQMDRERIQFDFLVHAGSGSDAGEEPQAGGRKPVKQTPQYDVVDLQKAAFEKAKQIENGVEKVKALIKKYGVETLPEMDKKHYEVFLKELEELV